MTLQEYISPRNSIAWPSVTLQRNEYEILHEDESITLILIPVIRDKYPQCSGLYYARAGESVLYTESSEKKSVFNLPTN